MKTHHKRSKPLSLLCSNLFLFTLLSLFSFRLFLPSISLAQSPSEYIHTFTSDITINQNGSLTIQETIPYHTDQSKHGIYRYIPTRLNINGFSLTTDIDIDSVTDNQSQPLSYTTPHKSGFVTLKIGDPDTTFIGDKTYRITYTVADALRQFSDHDELYWDITGEGWQFPLQTTQAQINSPYADITDIKCYSGAYGTDDGLCQTTITDPQTVTITYNQEINYGDNVTIAIWLDHQGSQLQLPGTIDRINKFIADNSYLLVIFAPTAIMFALWYAKGRDFVFVSQNIFDNDPDKPTKLMPLFSRHRTPMVYQPLHQLTPGEAGTILDERVDNQDVIAEIIDLARKKYLQLIPSDKKTLIFTSKDFTFKQLKDPDDKLPKHQSYLLKQIFKDDKEVALSSLKGKFYTYFDKAKSMIRDSAFDKKLFSHHPNTTRGIYLVIGILLAGAAFVYGILLAQQGIVAGIILAIVQFPAVILFGYHMVQKTALGTNYHLQAKGLQATIKRGKWREEIKEKNLFIEEVLPFAISLGVINQLSRDMDKLNLKPPDYLVANQSIGRGFTNSLIHSFSTQAASTLSYNPSSSSSSGGSGFSGGFSGGGGGGGGGGSW